MLPTSNPLQYCWLSPQTTPTVCPLQPVNTATMTSLTDIIAKFEAAFETFETTDERPTDLYVTQIYDSIAKIFYPIRYDIIGATHNLMGLIEEDAAYATKYVDSFPRMLRPSIYALDIDTTKDASLDIRKKEAVHKERIADWEIYDVARSEANSLSSTSSRMYGSLHFRRGVLRSMRSWKPRSCWTSSRLSARGTTQSNCWRSRTKCGQLTSAQTRFRNICGLGEVAAASSQGGNAYPG